MSKMLYRVVKYNGFYAAQCAGYVIEDFPPHWTYVTEFVLDSMTIRTFSTIQATEDYIAQQEKLRLDREIMIKENGTPIKEVVFKYE